MIRLFKMALSKVSGLQLWRCKRIVLRNISVSARCHDSESPPKVNPELPDYNTDVNIHQHRLKRPERPPPKWKGLKNLKENTKGSLIPETLQEMEKDDIFKSTLADLKAKGQKKLTKEERKKRQRALDDLGLPGFLKLWEEKRKDHNMPTTEKKVMKSLIDTIQLNIGIYCNQACNHCHVESSPKRKEMMDRETAERCLHVIANSPQVHTVDITGGAPELCSEFRYLAEGSRALGKTVIDRCNLTALLEPGQEDTAEFLAKHKIRIVASLPCYGEKNVNTQRGKGVFGKSIQALIMLNELGYGKQDSSLKLDLVYNPLGAFLPPDQVELKKQYQTQLMEDFGLEFNDLFTMTNMPIKRFVDFLYRRNELEDYMALLVRNYNLNTMDNLMCKNTLNVSWKGELYDCDFNQQLDMGLKATNITGNATPTVWDIEGASDLHDTKVVTDNHCFGCSAGMGSS